MDTLLFVEVLGNQDVSTVCPNSACVRYSHCKLPVFECFDIFHFGGWWTTPDLEEERLG